LSLIPRLALLDPRPAVVEPYLMAYLQKLGKFDVSPILESIRKQEFELVIGYDHDVSWRGVSLVPDIQGPIEAAYQRQCTMPGMVVYLPRGREAEPGLLEGLKNLRCVAN
jgi:hypothetical protein